MAIVETTVADHKVTDDRRFAENEKDHDSIWEKLDSQQKLLLSILITLIVSCISVIGIFITLLLRK